MIVSSQLNLARLASGIDLPLSALFREVERFDLERALAEPPKPPRRGRPRGSTRRG